VLKGCHHPTGAGLFKKVTGLDVKDFELLVSLGVFNDSLMNDAVYKFKRYEDASLSYTGINRHEAEDRGGWDTVISDTDYNQMFSLQQTSMEAPTPSPDDVPENPFADLTAAVTWEDDDEEEISTPAPVPVKPKPKPVAAKPQPTPIAPKPIVPKQIDTSGVQAGSTLRHKAFGLGTVKEISRGIVIVAFEVGEKKFQFPGAIQQGFLSISE
jgi:hypothetical protein